MAENNSINPDLLIRLVVGFDQREAVAYHVFCQSVLERTSQPVSFLPLVTGSIPSYSEKHEDGSNAFIYTRFLTPYLMGYEGWAVFADGDMVCNDDIAKLWSLRDPQKAIQVVKHNYRTKAAVKYLGNRNEDYPRKNWSSLVLWNCGHPKNKCLTPQFVSEQTGAFLHRFQWLEDNFIGEIPKTWNWLAIEYEPNTEASLIHYTLGTPCFPEYRETDQSMLWHATYNKLNEGFD